MTPNQRIFADEYLKDRNATRAYAAAYPRIKNPDVARAAGARLLANVNVSAYVQRRLDEISSAAVADAREILEFHTGVMRGTIKDRMLRFTAKGAQEIDEIPPRMADRIAAARELAKLIGADRELSPDAVRESNAQMLALAELINNPGPARTIEDVLKAGDGA